MKSRALQKKLKFTNLFDPLEPSAHKSARVAKISILK